MDNEHTFVNVTAYLQPSILMKCSFMKWNHAFWIQFYTAKGNKRKHFNDHNKLWTKFNNTSKNVQHRNIIKTVVCTYMYQCVNGSVNKRASTGGWSNYFNTEITHSQLVHVKACGIKTTQYRLFTFFVFILQWFLNPKLFNPKTTVLKLVS